MKTYGVKALPPEEGIETSIQNLLHRFSPSVKALPPEEGIETNPVGAGHRVPDIG